MKRFTINWERLAPAGVNAKRETAWTVVGMVASALWSLGAIKNMWDWWFALKGLPEFGVYDAAMPPYPRILGSALAGFEIMIVVLAALAIWHYVSHRQGSRSDYIMRRLPDRWELHRRCLAIPLAGIGMCILLAAALWALYFWIYVRFTPPEYMLDIYRTH